MAPDALDAACALGPIGQRRLLGSHALIFDLADGIDRPALDALGERRSPALADLFTACMSEARPCA